MNTMFKLMLFAFLHIALAQCSTPSEKVAASEESTKIATVSATNDSIPFPVYLTFDQFEPLLHYSNDTTYIINFWATWCKPCVAEMPYFLQLKEAYKDKPVKLVLVSMDFPKQYMSRLLPFVKERNIASSVVALGDMDYNAWIDKVSKEWDGAIPVTLVYNVQKRAFRNGEFEDFDDLEKFVTNTMP